MAISIEMLAEVGEFLHGPEWRRPLAKDLGPHHPQGARATIDPRLVARWAADTRGIPEWVGPALVTILTDRAGEAMRLALRLQRGF